MSLARIKQQANEADQMIRSLNEPSSEQPEVEAQPEVEVEQSVAADQGVPQEPEEQPQDSQPGGDWKEQAQLWEQRYRSLNGMIQSRDKQIQQLHELLAGMQQVSAQPQEHTASDTSLLTKEDEDNFGSDLVGMARRAAEEAARRTEAAILQRLDALEGSIQGVRQVTQVTAQERFEAKLDKLTKGTWKQIDTDPGFIAWLEKSTARQQVFAAGVQQQDATVLAEFFNDYATLAGVQREQADKPKQDRAAQLERQVSPGKSKSVGAPDRQAGDKKQWTRSEIASTYANRKQYAADEFLRLEREIATAQREGRVDFNR
jgi:hypothetical protein